MNRPGPAGTKRSFEIKNTKKSWNISLTVATCQVDVSEEGQGVVENITFYDKNTGRDALRAYTRSGLEWSLDQNNFLSGFKCKNQQIYQLVSRKKN